MEKITEILNHPKLSKNAKVWLKENCMKNIENIIQNKENSDILKLEFNKMFNKKSEWEYNYKLQVIFNYLSQSLKEHYPILKNYKSKTPKPIKKETIIFWNNQQVASKQELEKMLNAIYRELDKRENKKYLAFFGFQLAGCDKTDLKNNRTTLKLKRCFGTRNKLKGTKKYKSYNPIGLELKPSDIDSASRTMRNVLDKLNIKFENTTKFFRQISSMLYQLNRLTEIETSLILGNYDDKTILNYGIFNNQVLWYERFEPIMKKTWHFLGKTQQELKLESQNKNLNETLNILKNELTIENLKVFKYISENNLTINEIKGLRLI